MGSVGPGVRAAPGIRARPYQGLGGKFEARFGRKTNFRPALVLTSDRSASTPRGLTRADPRLVPNRWVFPGRCRADSCECQILFATAPHASPLGRRGRSQWSTEQYWTQLDPIGENSTNTNQTRSSSGQVAPDSVRSGPNLSKCGAKLADFGQMRPGIDQFGSSSTDGVHNSVDVRQLLPGRS